MDRRTKSDPSDLETPSVSRTNSFLRQLPTISEKAPYIFINKAEEEVITPISGGIRGCCSVLLRLVLAGVIIAIAIAALVFSIAEQDTKRTAVKAGVISSPLHPVDPYVNQVSYGTYKTIRIVNQTEWLEDQIESSWFQDNKNNRTLLTLGKKGTPDWIKNIFACPNDLFTAEPAEFGTICRRDNTTNYHKFIASFGYQHMRFLRKEVFADRGDMEVVSYIGYVIDQSSNTSSQVFRYVSPHGTNAQLGWDFHPANGHLNKIQTYEYWYGQNTTIQIPSHKLFELPTECANLCGDKECICWS